MNIGVEGILRLLSGAQVSVAMTGEFVPAGDDVSNDLGMTLRNPTQREKSGLRSMLVEQTQYPIHVAFDPALPGLPLGPIYIRRERRDLKVVFDINGQRVGDRVPAHVRAPPKNSFLE
jgi:hypothetical protein